MMNWLRRIRAEREKREADEAARDRVFFEAAARKQALETSVRLHEIRRERGQGSWKPT